MISNNNNTLQDKVLASRCLHPLLQFTVLIIIITAIIISVILITIMGVAVHNRTHTTHTPRTHTLTHLQYSLTRIPHTYLPNQVFITSIFELSSHITLTAGLSTLSRNDARSSLNTVGSMSYLVSAR